MWEQVAGASEWLWGILVKMIMTIIRGQDQISHDFKIPNAGFPDPPKYPNKTGAGKGRRTGAR